MYWHLWLSDADGLRWGHTKPAAVGKTYCFQFISSKTLFGPAAIDFSSDRSCAGSAFWSPEFASHRVLAIWHHRNTANQRTRYHAVVLLCDLPAAQSPHSSASFQSSFGMNVYKIGVFIANIKKSLWGKRNRIRVGELLYGVRFRWGIRMQIAFPFDWCGTFSQKQFVSTTTLDQTFPVCETPGPLALRLPPLGSFTFRGSPYSNIHIRRVQSPTSHPHLLGQSVTSGLHSLKVDAWVLFPLPSEASEGETPFVMAPGVIHGGIIMISASEDNLSVSMARKKVFQSERCCLSAQNNVLDIGGKMAVCSNSWIHSERKRTKKERHAPFAFYYFGWQFLGSSACCSDVETDVLSIINGQIIEDRFFFSLLLLIFLYNQNFKSDY